MSIQIVVATVSAVRRSASRLAAARDFCEPKAKSPGFMPIPIYNPLDRVGLCTYDKPNMKVNADGSVDLYFGPKAPKWLESNWIPTQGKRPIPVMRFYGGTEEFWNKSFKLPDVELLR